MSEFPVQQRLSTGWDNWRLYLGYVLGAAGVVLLFAVVQWRYVMGFGFHEFHIRMFVVPALVGGLFGYLMARIKLLQQHTSAYLETIMLRENQLREEIEMRIGVEASLRLQREQLEHLNQDLEAFSSSVSHDLRAPLRGIRGFSDILLEDYRTELSQEAADYLRRIHDASLRMGEIIEALLLLSRATRQEMHCRRFNLSEIAAQAAEHLREQHPQQSVAVDIDKDMYVEADQRLLQIVMSNLLDNAWKYSARTAHPCIHVGQRREAGETVYFVRDNGVGFDAEFADLIFEPFLRLHQEKHISGTGIGLSTVQRIIRRHAGQVWAEGETGKGATIYFRLKARGR